MRHLHWFVLLGILLVTGSLLAQGGSSPPPGWISYPSMPANPQLTAGFARFNTVPGRYDRNGDGRVDLIVADRNGDGFGDYWGTDRNFDGFVDDYQYDRNFDGRVDQWEFDTNLDGLPDRVMADLNGDGQPDIVGDYNPLLRSYAWYAVNSVGKNMALGLNAGARRTGKGKAGFSE